MIYSGGFNSRNDDYDNDFNRDGNDKYNDMTTFAKMRAGAGKRKHLWWAQFTIGIKAGIKEIENKQAGKFTLVTA